MVLAFLITQTEKQHRLLSVYGVSSFLCHTGNTFLLSCGVFAFYTVCFLHYQHFLLHCSNQILHHGFHRLNLIRTVGITSTKQQRVIQRTLCRIGPEPL